MTDNHEQRALSIFVHSATECLTDHLPHGEGLIFNDYLRALADRGHRMIGGAGQVALRDRHSSVSIEAVESTFILRSFRRLVYNYRLNRMLAERRRQGEIFDLVWRGNPLGELCPLCPQTFGLPLVVGPLFLAWPRSRTRIGFGPSVIAGRIARRGWRATLRRADLILATTPSLVRSCEMNSDIMGRVIHVPLIVTPPRNLTERVSFDRAGVLRIAFVGRLVAEKSPAVAIEAVETFVRRGYQVELEIAGDGETRQELNAAVRARGIDGFVKFLGAIPNEKVWHILARAHVLISTAQNEPYGRAIVEAMSVGTVPVVHNSGGPSEFIEHRRTGLLVSLHTADAFADALEALVTDKELYHSLSSDALRFSQAYNPENVGSMIESILYSIIPGQKRCESV